MPAISHPPALARVQSAADAVALVPLPRLRAPLAALAPSALSVSQDGQLLLVQRALAEGGRVSTLLDPELGRVIWERQGVDLPVLRLAPVAPFHHGDARLAPVALLLQADSGKGHLLRGDGRELSVTLGLDTRWAADGSWAGGGQGAIDSAGHHLGGPPLPVAPSLVLPGPSADTLRLVSEELVFVWDGVHEPIVEALWSGGAVERDRLLDPDGDLAPRPSPDGRYLVWHDREQPWRVYVCDLSTGEERELPQYCRAVVWTEPDTLWMIISDCPAPEPGKRAELWVWRLHQAGPQRAELPVERPERLAASLEPRALWVGTEEGRLWRLPL